MARFDDPVSLVRRRLLIGEGALAGLEGVARVLEKFAEGKIQTEADRREFELWAKRLGLEEASKKEVIKFQADLREQAEKAEHGRLLERIAAEGRIQARLAGLRGRGVKERELGRVKIMSLEDFANKRIAELKGKKDPMSQELIIPPKVFTFRELVNEKSETYKLFRDAFEEAGLDVKKDLIPIDIREMTTDEAVDLVEKTLEKLEKEA